VPTLRAGGASPSPAVGGGPLPPRGRGALARSCERTAVSSVWVSRGGASLAVFGADLSNLQTEKHNFWTDVLSSIPLCPPKKTQDDSENKRVVGVLLGEYRKGRLDVTSSFAGELPGVHGVRWLARSSSLSPPAFTLDQQRMILDLEKNSNLANFLTRHLLSTFPPRSSLPAPACHSQFRSRRMKTTVPSGSSTTATWRRCAACSAGSTVSESERSPVLSNPPTPRKCAHTKKGAGFNFLCSLSLSKTKPTRAPPPPAAATWRSSSTFTPSLRFGFPPHFTHHGP
jgi:hypothetical protein